MFTTTNRHHPSKARRCTAILTIAIAAMTVSRPAHAAPDTPPPWTHCAYADHPLAADLGPLVPAFTTAAAEVQAVLLGQSTVGTDCSIYDLPV